MMGKEEIGRRRSSMGGRAQAGAEAELGRSTSGGGGQGLTGARACARLGSTTALPARAGVRRGRQPTPMPRRPCPRRIYELLRRRVGGRAWAAGSAGSSAGPASRRLLSRGLPDGHLLSPLALEAFVHLRDGQCTAGPLDRAARPRRRSATPIATVDPLFFCLAFNLSLVLVSCPCVATGLHHN
jgi:hypothetical protein